MSRALAALKKWAENTPAGHATTYFSDGKVRDDAVFDLARKLHEAGLVFLAQRRNAKGVMEHVAIRTNPASRAILDTVSVRVDKQGRFNADQAQVYRAADQEGRRTRALGFSTGMTFADKVDGRARLLDA